MKHETLSASAIKCGGCGRVITGGYRLSKSQKFEWCSAEQMLNWHLRGMRGKRRCSGELLAKESQ